MTLDQRKFVTTDNEHGLSSNETIFHYYQNGDVITGTYKGGAIVEGFIVGKQTGEFTIELLFQCITNERELKVGASKGIISESSSGKLKLNFDWNWLNGDLSGGKSQYMEI